MKYIVFLGDGMADYPLPELQDRTPLQVAKKPHMDRLASLGELGLAKTVPDHLNPPGSDIANMSVLGYDPDQYYTGRSPLEAVSMGIQMAEEDLAIRCNLVTLSEEEPYEKKTMVDYSSDEISTEESAQLIAYLEQELGTDCLHFHAGISYRHCVLCHLPGKTKMGFTPPHDISGRQITEYLTQEPAAQPFLALMKKSYTLLKDHPINIARVAKGLHPANSIWLWGEGRKPGLSDFYEKYQLKGAVVSAVDLVKGLGICAGMEILEVPGSTGNIHTNFSGKAEAAIRFLQGGGEFVYIHVEAPDECGHRHEIENKVRSIELIDEKIVGPVVAALDALQEPYRVLIMPDHPTPLCLRTHTHDAVPYVLFDSRACDKVATGQRYTEQAGQETGHYWEKGHLLMDYFIRGSEKKSGHSTK